MKKVYIGVAYDAELDGIPECQSFAKHKIVAEVELDEGTLEGLRTGTSFLDKTMFNYVVEGFEASEFSFEEFKAEKDEKERENTGKRRRR